MMTRVNENIKRRAAGAGVYLWQVADKLGISDTSLSRKLRYKLSDDEEKRIIQVIEELAGDGSTNGN